MNKKIVFFMTVILFTVPFSGYAVEKFSCDELTASANDLDVVADAFAAAGVVRENDPIDLMLRDVVDSLHVYAAIEREGDLSIHVGRLESAWQNMDETKFADALDGVIDSLDRLWKRDCS